jgi:hypothetical protein
LVEIFLQIQLLEQQNLWNGTSWTTTTSMGSARYALGGAGTQSLALAIAGSSGVATEEFTGPSTTLNYKTLTTS